jgi:SAM-dependent methyltransferase
MSAWDDSAYGRGFADVYDDWYHDLTDLDACSAAVAVLAGSSLSPVLELGIGTGRIALALVARQLTVMGVDVSPDMVNQLRAKPGGDAIDVVIGDMVNDMPVGPFSVVLAAYNTVFNLMSHQRQQALFATVAPRLVDGGSMVVEAAVPRFDTHGDAIGVRTMTQDTVVLSVARYDVESHLAQGQFVQFIDGSVRLRPWQICWSTPQQLDEFAAGAGLQLVSRWADWIGTPFSDTAPHHVSVYRHR